MAGRSTAGKLLLGGALVLWAFAGLSCRNTSSEPHEGSIPGTPPREETVWERPQDLAAGVVSKKDLDEGADLARRISFNLLSSDELSSYTGLEYRTDDRWHDWNFDPEDREMSEGLASEGFGAESDIREALFDAGFLRRIDVSIRATEQGHPCSIRVPAHGVVTTLLVFGDGPGAAQFFETTLMPHLNSTGYLKGPDYAGVLLEQNNACQVAGPVCCEYDDATNKETTESVWHVRGPFVMRVQEFSIDYDRDNAHTTLQYAFDQMQALADELPSYFSQ